MDSQFLDLLQQLKSSSSSQDIYQKIILLGKSSPYKQEWNFQENDKVSGCQSLLYIKGFIENGRIQFRFFSDALISQGLAALLVHYYTDSEPKFILTTPPTFIKDLNLTHLLSMGRSNGLQSLYKKILEITISICKEL